MDAFTLVAKLTLNRAEFDSGLKEVETDINSPQKTSTFSAWGVAVGNLAAKAFSRAFSAASGFAKSIITTGMDFDSMMSEVKAVGGLTEEQFEAVRQKAIDLGASTKFTSKEVGEAFYYMGLAGWKSEEMLSGIEGVLNLAAASGENLGTVSDIVTDAITAMGLTAEDTARFVNVLAAASTNSNTTVGMMGEAFKYLATTGGVLQYSIEDVATVLGLLANNGIKASQAGTSMRQILNTLIAPSDKAAVAMEELGLSLFEVGTDKRKPLMQVVEELRDIFKNADFDLGGKPMEEVQANIDELNEWYDTQKKLLDERKATKTEYKDLDKEYEAKMQAVAHFNEDFLAKLSAVGGLRGISSLFALMKATDEDVNQLVGAVTNSSEGQGAAQKMAETMIDNLEGDITLLNSALDGLKILMSDDYKGALRGFVQVFTEEIGNLSKAFNEGGISGMLINLTDWIINGITDTLSNPEITVEGANKFGQALGDFVGHLVSKLVTSAPEMIGGLFTAGMNLAGGLVEGLFSGLFGTGENTIVGILAEAEEEGKEAIKQANANAAQANAIIGYMSSLSDQYGNAAMQSGEWATSLEKLERLIPGITNVVKDEETSLVNATRAMRDYVAVSREQAEEEAKKATLAKYQEAYDTAQSELLSAQVAYEAESGIAKSYLSQLLAFAGTNTGVSDLQSFYSEWEEALENGTKDIYDLLQLIAPLLNDVDENTENYYTAMFDGYKEASEAAEENASKLGTLTETAQFAKAKLDAATAAFENVTGSLNALADRADSALTSDETRSTPVTGGGRKKNITGVGNAVTTNGVAKKAKGDWYVPYDDYPALLHRGEAVLTASQARQFRENASGANIDISALTSAIVGAVQEGLRDAQVNAYLDGNRVTREVSRIMNDQMMLAR